MPARPVIVAHNTMEALIGIAGTKEDPMLSLFKNIHKGLEEYKSTPYIAEYFNDNNIPSPSPAQKDSFIERRKKYEKAQMTVATVSEKEQVRHFFNLYDIPFQITKTGQNKGKLRVMPLREKDLEVMRKAKRALRDNGYGWAAEKYKVFRDDKDNAVVTFGPEDRPDELPGVVGDFEVEISKWSIYGITTGTVVCRVRE